MGWKENLSFLSPRFITHAVNGTEQNFYTVATRTAFRLRVIAGPLARSLAVLFRDRRSDGRTVLKQNGEVKEQVLDGPSPELTDLLIGKNEKAYESLIAALCDEPSKRVIAALVCDSMRDVFPRNMSDKELDEFINDPALDIASLGEMLTGVVLANKDAFGPLAKQIEDAVKGSKLRLVARDEEPLPEPEMAGVS